MGSPLHPTLANIFMYSFQIKWLKHWLYDLKPVFCRLCVNDISSVEHAEKFKDYLFSKHPSINFLFETEKNGRLPFLSIFYVKKENLSLMFIGKRPSLLFILISTASYLNSLKLV